MGRRTLRILAGILIGVPLALLLVLAVAVTVGPELAAPRLAAWLRAAGVPVRSLTIHGVGLHGVELTAISIGDDAATIAEVAGTYSPGRLYREGRLDRITVSGVRLRLAIDAAGRIVIPGLDLSRLGGGAGAEPDLPLPTAIEGETRAVLPPLPADEIVLDDAEVGLDTPLGRFTVALAARLHASAEGGARLTGTAEATGPAGRLRLSLNGRIDAAGRWQGGIGLEDGRLAAAAVSLDRIGGWAEATGALGGLTGYAAELTVARVSMPPGELADLSLIATGGDAPGGLPDRLVLRAASPDGVSRLAADASIAGTPAQLTVQIDAALAELAPVARAAGLDPVVTGRGVVALDAALPLAPWFGGSAAETDADAERTAAGTAAVWLDGVTLPGTTSDLGAEAALRWAFEDGRLSLGGVLPWHLAGTIEALDTKLGGPVRLVLAPLPEAPPRLIVAPGRDGAVEVSAAAGLALDAPAVQGDGTVRVRVVLPGQSAPADANAPPGQDTPRFDLAFADLSLSALPVQGLRVEPRRVRLAGSGTPSAFSLDIAGEFGVTGRAPGGVIPQAGVVGLAGAATLSDGVLRFRPDGCVDVTVAALAIAHTVYLTRPTALCLQAPAASEDGGERAMVEHDLAGPAPGRTRLAFAVPGADTAMALDFGGGSRIDLGMALPALAVEMDLPPDRADHRIAVGLSGGAVHAPALGFTLSGMNATVAVVPEGEPQVVISLGGATVLAAGQPPPVVPLGLAGTGRVGQDGGVAFDLAARGAAGVLALTATGRHDGASGAGTLAFRLAPVTFTPGARQPATLFPVLAGLPIEAAGGTVSVQGRLGWGPGASSEAELRLQDGAVAVPGLAADRIAATLRATSLLPLVLPAGQRVTVGALDIGLPMTDGELVFGLTQGQQVEVSALGFDWAGGRLSARPFAARFGAAEQAITLRAENIDLAELLAAAPVEHLAVTGRLSGDVPVRLVGDTIVIDHAELESNGPGTIQYAPPAEPVAVGEDASGGVALLLDAVRNFHYDSLTLILSGQTGRTLQVGFRLRGANPDLYGGYPIALNVNVSGALDRILRQSLATTRFGREVEDYYRDRAAGAGVTVIPADPAPGPAEGESPR